MGVRHTPLTAEHANVGWLQVGLGVVEFIGCSTGLGALTLLCCPGEGPALV